MARAIFDGSYVITPPLRRMIWYWSKTLGIAGWQDFVGSSQVSMCALRFTGCLVAAREAILGHFDLYVKFVKFGNLIGLCVLPEDCCGKSFSVLSLALNAH